MPSVSEELNRFRRLNAREVDDLEFYTPQTIGEWLSFASATITVFFGLLLFLAPRLSFRILRLQTSPDHPEAVSEGRATMAGFYLGVGLCCILLAQPLIYLALGASWVMTAFGRLISIVSDNGNTSFNWISIIIEFGLGVLPLLHVFGWIA